jgi:hypothetical protein
MVMFHVTRIEHRDSIREHGLDHTLTAHATTTWGGSGGAQGQYLHGDLKTAKRFAAKSFAAPGADVWAVCVGGLDVHVDPRMANAYFVAEPILAQRAALHGTHVTSNGGDWYREDNGSDWRPTS